MAEWEESHSPTPSSPPFLLIFIHGTISDTCLHISPPCSAWLALSPSKDRSVSLFTHKHTHAHRTHLSTGENTPPLFFHLLSNFLINPKTHCSPPPPSSLPITVFHTGILVISFHT